MNKQKLFISGSILFALLLASIVALSATGQLPFTVFPEEKGNFGGDHQYPSINGSIPIAEDYSGNLTALASISKTTAEQLALNYTTGGSVVSSQLDIENGYLVWNVIVNYNGQKYEIIVDAGNGDILWTSLYDGSESNE